MTMRIKDWFEYEGVRVPLHVNLRVGPAQAMIDPPPPPKHGIEGLIDSAFLTLAQTNPLQRYPMFYAWVREDKPYAQQFMGAILAQPHEATVAAMEAQRVRREERGGG